MLALENAGVVVIDCGGDVVQRLLAHEVDLDRIEALILTHEHPDHVAGFPLFMEKIWLAQRRRPIPVCGPAPALDQARRIFEAFDMSGWDGLPEIDWRVVELREEAPVWTSEHWRITASPGVHSVPVIGLRAEDLLGGGTAVYSADTERTDSIQRLASGVDVLVHEATGGFHGHTSIGDAAALASAADAARLVVVHLPPAFDPDDIGTARERFPGLEVGADGDQLDF